MTLSLDTRIARNKAKHTKLLAQKEEITKKLWLLDIEFNYLNSLQDVEKAKIPQHSVDVLGRPPEPESKSIGVPPPVPIRQKGDCPACTDGLLRRVSRTLGNGKTITLTVCGDCGNESLI